MTRAAIAAGAFAAMLVLFVFAAGHWGLEHHVDRAGSARGGSGLLTPDREDAVWVVTRDIHLGRGVPSYPGR